MGLLDDAIREHLELKRKHGADPDDVARQEQEALGPGLRNEFAQPEGRRAGRRGAGAASRSRGRREPAARRGPGGASQEPPPEPAAGAAGYEEDPWLADEPDEVPADEALGSARAAAGEEDVLEETPEFLQETPEHDRLWFEQKPPRDFDWDK